MGGLPHRIGARLNNFAERKESPAEAGLVLMLMRGASLGAKKALTVIANSFRDHVEACHQGLISCDLPLRLYRLAAPTIIRRLSVSSQKLWQLVGGK